MISATTWGAGVPWGFEENIEPRLIVRWLHRRSKGYFLRSKWLDHEEAKRLRPCKLENVRWHRKVGFGLHAWTNEARNIPKTYKDISWQYILLRETYRGAYLHPNENEEIRVSYVKYYNQLADRNIMECIHVTLLARSRSETRVESSGKYGTGHAIRDAHWALLLVLDRLHVFTWIFTSEIMNHWGKAGNMS